MSKFLDSSRAEQTFAAPENDQFNGSKLFSQSDFREAFSKQFGNRSREGNAQDGNTLDFGTSNDLYPKHHGGHHRGHHFRDTSPSTSTDDSDTSACSSESSSTCETTAPTSDASSSVPENSSSSSDVSASETQPSGSDSSTSDTADLASKIGSQPASDLQKLLSDAQKGDTQAMLADIMQLLKDLGFDKNSESGGSEANGSSVVEGSAEGSTGIGSAEGSAHAGSDEGSAGGSNEQPSPGSESGSAGTESGGSSDGSSGEAGIENAPSANNGTIKGSLADVISQNDKSQNPVLPAGDGLPKTAGWYGGATGNAENDNGTWGQANEALGWGIVYAKDGTQGNPNATVQVADMATYAHLKDGGWVQLAQQDGNNFGGAHYVPSFGDNPPVDMPIDSSGGDVASFKGASNALIDHFWMGKASIDPSKVDGYFVTAEARTDTPNSNLVMQLGSDVYKGNQYLSGIGNSNWKELTTDWQNVYFTNLDASLLQKDPPPGISG